MLILFLIPIVVTIGYFWTESRYPALDRKAYFGDRNLMAGISFDVVWPVGEDASFIERVAASTTNWYYTNWKGMTFGLILATFVLAMLRGFRPAPVRNRLGSTLLGMGVGAPLGVCVNCATPIGQSLRAAGARAETALALTMSSPTLNVVVLSILFTSFPQYFIVTKLSATLLMILVMIPLLTKFLGPKRWAPAVETRAMPEPSEPVLGWWASFLMFLRLTLAGALEIIRSTLPMMLLAGFLGSLVVESVGGSSWAEESFSIGRLMLVSLVGTFLPVPMSFDVLTGTMLLENGMRSGYVAALLVTLGMFSIYPFLVFRKTISLRIAVGIFATVWALGVTAGWAVNEFEIFQANRTKEKFDSHLLADLESFMANPTGLVSRKISEVCTSSEKTLCPLELVRAAVDEGGPESLCKLLDKEDQKQCLKPKSSFTMKDLDYLCKTAEDASDCLHDVIEDLRRRELTSLRNECVAGVASDQCRTLKSYLFATMRPPAKLCQRLKIRSLRDRCQLDAANYEARRTSYSAGLELCGLIRNRGIKEKCRFQVTVRAHEFSRCRDLGPSRVRCENKIALRMARKGNPDQVCEKYLPDRQGECVAVGKVARAKADLRVVARLANILPLAREHLASPVAEKHARQAPVNPPKRGQFVSLSGGIEVSTFGYEKSRIRMPNKARGAFFKVPGNRVGLDRKRISSREFFEDHRGYGLAAGDYDGDGWIDVLAGEYGKLLLYHNREGSGFEIVELDTSELRRILKIGLLPTVVALVDLNHDGWPDIFVGNMNGTAVMIPNRLGRFDMEHVNVLAEMPGAAGAVAFDDFDKDGFVDIFWGGRAFAKNSLRNASDEASTNFFLWGGPRGFDKRSAGGLGASSLSALAFDLDGDGRRDIWVANDFDLPDEVYLNRGERNMEAQKNFAKLIPHTVLPPMSLDVGDIDNDLQPEIFEVGISLLKGGPGDYCEHVGVGQDQECRNARAMSAYAQALRLDLCAELGGENSLSCLITAVHRLSRSLEDPSICDFIPAQMSIERYTCRTQKLTAMRGPDREFVGSRQDVSGNGLYKRQADGSWQNVAKALGADVTGWGWTSRFVDLDGDGWQDIYSANGALRYVDFTSNVFLHNQQGKGFRAEQTKYGLEDFVDTTSVVFADFDRDGDLDIVANGMLSPMRFFLNDIAKNQFVSFELLDEKANRSCLGCRIIIRYREGDEDRQQMREVKMGGGYASYDPAEANFGVGSAGQLDSIEILWSTGESSTINQPLKTGRHYRLRRLQDRRTASAVGLGH
ncbi:MAG: FG-GAP-like repeat-containing protein [Bdellovibrionales bacterium]